MKMRRILFVMFLAVLAVAAQAQLAPGAWAKNRNDSLNTGRSLYSGTLDIIKWRFNISPAKNFAKAPVVSMSGIVYVASTNGDAYAINGVDGSLVWQSTIGLVSYSTPALGSDGTVYIGTDAGILYALNGNTGATIWSVAPSKSGAEALGPPAIAADGTIYLGCMDGFVYALDGKTGALKWSHNGGPHAIGQAQDMCPAIGTDGTIYIGGGNELYALNPADGSLIWTFTQILNPFTSASVGANGTVYAGCGDGRVYALDGQTGAQIWSFMTGGAVISTPAIGSDGTLYFGSDDKNLYAVNGTTGDLVWSYELGEGVFSSALIAGDGTIYIGTVTTLYSVDGKFGQLNWSAEFGDLVYDSAMGPDGVLYVPSSIGYLVAFTSGFIPSSLTLSPPEVLSGSPSTGTITLNGPAPKNGALIILACDTSGVTIPNSVTIPAGQTSVTFPVSTVPTYSQEYAQITASYNGVTLSTILAVDPIAVTSLTLAPTTLQGGGSSTGTVTLNEPAPPGGAIVSVSSDNPAAIPPTSVTIPAGQTTATFQVPTIPVSVLSTANIAAATTGTSAVTAPLTVLPPTLVSFTLNPTTVTGGINSTGTVTLSGMAPANGIKVVLTNNSKAVNIPAFVIVSGQTNSTFTVVTGYETQQVVATITAALATASFQAQLTINPSLLKSVSVNPSTVTGGANTTGTVTLNAAAPAGGVAVTLFSNTQGIIMPATLTVPAGQTSATFNASTPLVVSQFVATISASLAGITQTTNLTLIPLTLSSLTISPTSVPSGNSATATLTLNGPAPSAGFVVALSCNNTSAKVPGSVTVPAGQMGTTFQISTSAVTAQATATVTASLNGQSPITATLTIQPAVFISLVLSPSIVPGGSTSTGTVALSGIAPSGGITASLSTSSTDAIVPPTVTVAAGQSSASFTIHTGAVTSPVQAPIVAQVGSISEQATLTINPPQILSVTLSPSTVNGGTSSTGTVTLTALAPKGGFVIKLASNLKSATVPASVSIIAGKTTAIFTVKTVAVSADVNATISASLATQTQSALLTIDSPRIVSVAMSPNSVLGGTSSTGAVSLSSVAPAGGLVIKLSSNQSAAQPSVSVTVPAGRVGANFTVKTTAVGSLATASIQATIASGSVSSTLTINPPVLMSLTLSPASVKGGKSSTGKVTISGPAPVGGLVISLSSSNMSATMPASAAIPAGKTSVTFSITSAKVGAPVTAMISSTLASVTKSASLTIS